MHESALVSGDMFADMYGFINGKVLDIGGRNVNGSLRDCFESKGMLYTCVDIEEHPSVDCVVKPGDRLPFDDASFDFIVSTSCFEHDPCFWLTFKEMSRIIKPTGYIYINAPSGGPYHCYPGDNWRFYPDAGQALAYWSGKQIATEDIFPLKVVETFIIDCSWGDFVCVWKRVNIEDKEETITTHSDIRNNTGRLEVGMRMREFNILKTCTEIFP